MLFDNNKTRAENLASQLLLDAERQASQIAMLYEINYRKLWMTPGVDPKDVFAALGTSAALLFQVTNTTMGVAAPDKLKSIPSQYTYAINPDGSITLADVPPESA